MTEGQDSGTVFDFWSSGFQTFLGFRILWEFSKIARPHLLRS